MHRYKQFIALGLLISSINSDAAINPANLFKTTANDMRPAKYWLTNKPYPTNAWFINFAMPSKNGSSSEPVNVFPYLVQLSLQGMSISYSSAISYTDPLYPNIISALYYQFGNQLTLGSLEPMDYYGISSSHGLQVTVEWANAKQQKVTAPIVQGSPYSTQFFNNATPKLTSRFKWLMINKQEQTVPLEEQTRFELILSLDNIHTQTWLLYSEKPIQFIWTTNEQGEQLIAANPYSGWIRLVLQKDSAHKVNNDEHLLDCYKDAIPFDYKQEYFHTPTSLGYSLEWLTLNNKPPLMLTLPHQRQEPSAQTPIAFMSIKGLLLGSTQKIWRMTLPLLPIEFLEPKTLAIQQQKILRTSLLEEAAAFIQQFFPQEGPYITGKRLAKTARLALIAEYLQDYETQKQLVRYMKKRVTPIMLGSAQWYFEYDTTWGGIIPSIDDYGARHYTDHHYHYGYWVYTFAVLARYDPSWLKSKLKGAGFTPQQWIEQLIYDYANYDNQNPYYPPQRYQDDYAGHSWASGLTSSTDGQNEQSSSEAVNAYYAAALYAKTMNNSPLFSWAQFLMSRELVSAQTYWQIQKNNFIYSQQYTKDNQVIGNLWATKVDSNAFFVPCSTEYRCGLQYSFGIQMLPFTAISSYLFDREWLFNAYPTVKKLLNNKYGTITPAWKWILIKGLIFIMDKKEKSYFFQNAIDSPIEEYDNGDSKTNTLYFLADDANKKNNNN